MINQILLSLPYYYFVIWLVIFVVAIIIEATEPQLISIWFAGGAFVAFILSLIPGIHIWVQIVTFILTTALLLTFSFMFFRKSFLNSRKISTNSDALVDEEVILLSEASREVLGEVIYGDVIWKVTPKEATEKFKKGDTAIVDSIRGNRLVIKRKEQ